MKAMKSTICILLTLTLLLSLAVPVLAADELFEKGSILIRNTETVTASNKSFVAYKILDLRVWVDESGNPVAEQPAVPSSLAEAYAELCGLDREAVDFDTRAAQMLLQEADLSKILAVTDSTPYTGIPTEDGYAFRWMPLGYYIIKDTSMGMEAEYPCELMLAKVAPDCVLEPKLHAPTMEIIAADTLGNRVAGAEFTLSGEAVEDMYVSWDDYTLDEDGQYWLLKNGSYTLRSPDSIVDGVPTDKNVYASCTEKYTRETFTERVTTDGNNTVRGISGVDGTLRFTGMKEGEYHITTTTIYEKYTPITESATITVSYNESTGQFEYQGDVDDEGKVTFVFLGGYTTDPIPSPRTDPNLTLKHSLNIADDISVNYIISEELLEGYDMDSLELQVFVSQYEGNSIVDYTMVPATYEKRDGYCYFTLTGLTAVQMNDEIFAHLYGIKDGEAYLSPQDVYSVATYALSQLNKSNASRSLKTLCADLLRYGAMAQTYKGYRTEALADALMTSEHRAYLTDLDTVTFGNQNLQIPNAKTTAFDWIGKGLNLETKVGLTFCMEQIDPDLSYEDWKIIVNYNTADGEQISYEIPKTEITRSTENGVPVYKFSFSQLAAADLRSVVCVTVYDMGNNPLSATLVYSADTYGNGKIGTLGQLCKALFAYSDSARAYLAG